MTEPGKRALVLAPLFDTPGRHDASGAFQPEARRFVAVNGLAATVRLFDSSRVITDRRRECSQVLSRQITLDVLALFCHGWKNGVQAGWSTAHTKALADMIVLAGTAHPGVVALYCCDTGRDQDQNSDDDRDDSIGGQGGFADQLWEGLKARGWRGRLFGHTTAGHTTQNPWVRVWGDWGLGDLQDGHWLVDPKGPHWKAWKLRLREPQDRLRYQFPFLTQTEILARLGA